MHTEPTDDTRGQLAPSMALSEAELTERVVALVGPLSDEERARMLAMASAFRATESFAAMSPHEQLMMARMLTDAEQQAEMAEQAAIFESFESAATLDFISPRFVVGDIGFVCFHCGFDTPMEDVRGDVREVTEQHLEVETYGHCAHCTKLSAGRMRLGSDGSVSCLVDGQWVDAGDGGLEGDMGDFGVSEDLVAPKGMRPH